jgi:hypothetical protein
MINAIDIKGKKLFAVIDENDYVIDCWVADTIEEAQNDNPNKKIILVRETNSPFRLGQKYFLKE